MNFWFAAFQMMLGMIVGFIVSFSVSTVGCCLFCGIPMSKILMRMHGCFHADKLYGMYWKSVALHTLIVFTASWAADRFAPGYSKIGFFFAIFFSVVIGCGKWGMNVQNISEVIDKAWNYVIPGKEDEAEAALNDAVLEIAERKRNRILPTWVIICVAVMLITAFAVLYSGMSSKIETEREEAYKEGYEEGYDSGYDSGITDGEYKLKTYKSKNNSPDGNSVKEISVYVKNQYGITPSEAAEIVLKYNNPGGNGKPTWEEYQNALAALAYAGKLIG